MPVETRLTIRDPGQRVTVETPTGAVTIPRDIDVRLYAPDAPGTYPLVLYSHGHRALLDGAVATHARAMAEAGYVVAVPAHLDSIDLDPEIWQSFPFEAETTLHRVADLQALIDSADALAAALPEHGIDASRPVVAGHSHGARAAMLLAGAEATAVEIVTLGPGNPYGLETVADPRVAGVVALSPPRPDGGTTPGFVEGSWDALPVPSLWITGTEDETPLVADYRDRLDGFDRAPAAGRVAYVLEGATHAEVAGQADATTVAAIGTAIADFLAATVGDDPAAATRLADPAGALARIDVLAEAYAGTEGAVEIVDGSAAGREATSDTLILSAPLAGAALDPAKGGFILRLPEEPAASLFSVDRLVFEDAALARDTSGAAVSAALLYFTAYGREGEPGGLAFWTGALSGGAPVLEVASAFADSPEFEARFGADLSDAAYVEALYLNALGRAPDPGGLAYWTGELASGARDRGEMLADFALSPENREIFENEIDDGVWLLA